MDDTINLIGDIVMRAKQSIVKRDGIGAEISPFVVATNIDGEMIGFAQLARPPKSAPDRYKKMAAAAYLMRTSWHAAMIGVILEGYYSKRSVDDNPIEPDQMAVKFASGDQSVTECLSMLFHDQNDIPYAMTLPYRIDVGRVVKWSDDPIYVKGTQASGALASMLKTVMAEVECIPFTPAVPEEASLLAASFEIHDLGFLVTCEGIGEGQEWLDQIQYGAKGRPDHE